MMPAPRDGLGQAVRARRLERGLTLVELAGRSGLSHPFLSQIENDRAQPSMDSLYRIAGALATTPQSFFGADQNVDAVQLVRRGQAPVIGGADDSGAPRLLVGGTSPFRVLDFVALTPSFERSHCHDGYETAYVVAGSVEIDLDGELTRLAAGEAMSYPARREHRHRSVGRHPAHLLLIEASAGSTGGGEGAHGHLLEHLDQ